MTTPGLQPPKKIGRATIKTRCGSAKWGDGGVFDATYGTATINAGDGIGLFIVSNNDENNVMRSIANRMTETQIEAVSEYLQGLQPR